MKTQARGVAVMVGYYAPPAVGIAAQRLRGFLRHLPEYGWDPVLVAPASAHFHRSARDGSDGADVVEGLTPIRVPNPELSRWLRRLAGGAAPEAARSGDVIQVEPVQVGATGSWLRRAVREWLYVPDAQVLWIPGAARAVAEQVRAARGRPTVVFSTSVPYSCHFAARRGARGTGVPWVAEYRDPWSLAPPQFGRRSRARQRIDTRLDHDLVAAAAHLVVTSDSTARRYREGFPDAIRGGVSVVRNGFDELVDDDAPERGAPLRLVYSGTLLDGAYAQPLLGALRTLHVEEPGQVVLDVYGPQAGWPEAERAEVPYLGLHGLVPPDRMAGLLAGASALVLLQPEPRHAQHVAGKLYEYIGARRPVLAVIPEGCEAHHLLQDHGEVWQVPSMKEEAMLEALRGLLGAHRSGTLQGARVQAAQVEPLSRRAQAGALAGIFDRLGGRR